MADKPNIIKMERPGVLDRFKRRVLPALMITGIGGAAATSPVNAANQKLENGSLGDTSSLTNNNERSKYEPVAVGGESKIENSLAAPTNSPEKQTGYPTTNIFPVYSRDEVGVMPSVTATKEPNGNYVGLPDAPVGSGLYNLLNSERQYHLAGTAANEDVLFNFQNIKGLIDEAGRVNIVQLPANDAQVSYAVSLPDDTPLGFTHTADGQPTEGAEVLKANTILILNPENGSVVLNQPSENSLPGVVAGGTSLTESLANFGIVYTPDTLATVGVRSDGTIDYVITDLGQRGFPPEVKIKPDTIVYGGALAESESSANPLAEFESLSNEQMAEVRVSAQRIYRQGQPVLYSDIKELEIFGGYARFETNPLVYSSPVTETLSMTDLQGNQVELQVSVVPVVFTDNAGNSYRTRLIMDVANGELGVTYLHDHTAIEANNASYRNEPISEVSSEISPKTQHSITIAVMDPNLTMEQRNAIYTSTINNFGGTNTEIGQKVSQRSVLIENFGQATYNFLSQIDSGGTPAEVPPYMALASVIAINTINN